MERKVESGGERIRGGDIRIEKSVGGGIRIEKQVEKWELNNQ